MLKKITPLILTFNEEANIERTLKPLYWASEVLVVDSGSDDRTLEIISKFPNARVVTRKFDSHAKQWNFGLHQCRISTEWVLALDADYVLTEQFIQELVVLVPNDHVGGYQASFRYCIGGKMLRGSLYPPVTVLYRHEGASYIQDGHTQRVSLNHKTETISGCILHDDRKPFDRWLSAQFKYARLELAHLLQTPFLKLQWPDRLRHFYVLMPFLTIIYCLFIKRGIFDGKAGIIYAMQRSIAEAVLALVMLKHRLGFLK